MNDVLQIFLLAVLAVLAVCVLCCLIRAVKGPTISDRIVSVNMIGTIVIMMIAILTVLMKEAWLADIAAVYAMLSFLAVVVLTKIYIGVYREKKEEQKHD